MRPERYNVRESEAKWQKAWADAQVFKTRNDDPRPKYYVLEMFPYPSGRIHMGHVRNYAMGDVVARYRRARGFNVLHPMGWDAFGMPAENAAMQNNTHPAKWTYANIDTMRAQLQSMGLSLDWSREIATCDPSYYKHQQKLFLDFLAAGLVARKKSKVNWDPVDHTVLANEQVIDGRGWRSGAVVEQRELTQWFLKITDYSDDLLASLDRLDRWPEKVRLMQRNWIGRSEGLMIRFVVDPATLGPLAGRAGGERTRNLYDAPRHAVRREIHGDRARSSARQPPPRGTIRRSPPSSRNAAGSERRSRRSRRRKRRATTRACASSHPFDPDWRLPVYVANFILMDYGTGAIFGCPAHDQRDLDFVNVYGLGATPVVCPPGVDPATFTVDKVAYDGDGVMINSRFLDGMTIEAAKEEVARRLEAVTIGNRPQAKRQVNLQAARLGHFAPALLGLPDPDHPLRKLRRRAGPGQGSAGQAARRRRRSISRAIRSTATRPGSTSPVRNAAGRRGARPTRWTRSSIRPGTSSASPIRRMKRRRPIRRSPITGCRSTSISAASSTRSCICSIRASSPARCANAAISISTSPSPAFSRRAWSFTRPIATQTANGSRRPRFRSEADAEGRRAFRIGAREPVEIGPIEKMSKSKRNTVDPDDIIATYGADTARWFMLSDSPPERDVIWTEAGVQGAFKQTQRLWRLTCEIERVVGPERPAAPATFGDEAQRIRRIAHGALAKIEDEIERLRFNVCIATIYEFANALGAAVGAIDATPVADDLRFAFAEAGDILVHCFAPMMPHLAEECWEALGHTDLRGAKAPGRSPTAA